MNSAQEIEKESSETLATVITDLPATESPLPETIRNACKLFSALSREDAFALFIRAKDGLRSNKDSPRQANLTRKQYYTRLKNLVDVGLIKKSGYSYRHTTFGSLIYENYLAIVLHGIKNLKQMQMIDTLQQSHMLSKDEITNMTNAILKEPKI